VTAPRGSVVIHGHFYQPPREDPWLDELEAEPSAAPFHDWNERIERECYRAVVAARLYAPDGRIARIVNTLASISFDVGPTLLEWMERHAPATYARILEADRISAARHQGHGNAIAQPYHHIILPLASRRDKITEVRWGMADFRRRFGRDPAGMWLPETAVDAETLDVLAAEGIRFTILAPHQVEAAPAHGLPGLYRTSGGRTIALFVYDGPTSHDVAFGDLTRNAERWTDRMLDGLQHRRLVTIATDGETYGHHHKFGEVALAWLLDELPRRHVEVDNCAAFLARHPADREVALAAPSSWSCPHGVERWRADCGCRVGSERSTNQRWRVPLREGLDWLATELHALYEREGAGLLGDPWAARDACASGVAVQDVRARELLELERNALRMFTSCGWFFDDIAGIEARQVLRYAGRAIELAGADAPRLEAGLLERLAAAESNDDTAGDGRDVYLDTVMPAVPAPERVAAGYAALRAVAADAAGATPAGYTAQEVGHRVRVTHGRTGREYEFAVSVQRHGLARLTIEVAGAPVAVAALAERQRVALRAALRWEVIEHRFTAAERADLASGRADLAHVAAQALVRAIAALEHERSSEAVAAVHDLADLLHLHNLHIPFDVQTEAYRVGAHAIPDVARWLGFVEPGTA
jgi:alpha-amylase/alpha-mannosidase (GH57 family)